jgi:hypothetical protein
VAYKGLVPLHLLGQPQAFLKPQRRVGALLARDALALSLVILAVALPQIPLPQGDPDHYNFLAVRPRHPSRR